MFLYNSLLNFSSLFSYSFIDENFVVCGFSRSYQLGMQEPASELFADLYLLHDLFNTYLSFILVFVSYLLFFTSINFDEKNKKIVSETIGHKPLEACWNVLPIGFLIALAGPSIAYLDSTENYTSADLEIQVIARQWYWSYEIMLFDTKFRYDSRMLSEQAILENGIGFRQLEVDNRLILPIHQNIKFIISSSDVIHCFAVPALGLKVDAVPGRLNQIITSIDHTGIFYGQCSEICGQNHAHMPIVIEAVTPLQYYYFIAYEYQAKVLELTFDNSEEYKQFWDRFIKILSKYFW